MSQRTNKRYGNFALALIYLRPMTTVTSSIYLFDKLCYAQFVCMCERTAFISIYLSDKHAWCVIIWMCCTSLWCGFVTFLILFFYILFDLCEISIRCICLFLFHISTHFRPCNLNTHLAGAHSDHFRKRFWQEWNDVTLVFE